MIPSLSLLNRKVPLTMDIMGQPQPLVVGQVLGLTQDNIINNIMMANKDTMMVNKVIGTIIIIVITITITVITIIILIITNRDMEIIIIIRIINIIIKEAVWGVTMVVVVGEVAMVPNNDPPTLTLMGIAQGRI